MYWFVCIALCLIIAFITWESQEARRQEAAQEAAYKEVSGIVEFCEAATTHTSYYELKRDRKQLLEVFKTTNKLNDLGMVMLNNTINRIDAKLAGFSDEEKQIYDAIYGENEA